MGGTWPGSNSYWDNAAASWAPRKMRHQPHFRNKVTTGVTRNEITFLSAQQVLFAVPVIRTIWEPGTPAQWH